jgi:hypothetical protein
MSHQKILLKKSRTMPLPKPRDGEGRQLYLARFMAETKDDRTLTRSQRQAIAYETWRKYMQERNRGK